MQKTEGFWNLPFRSKACLVSRRLTSGFAIETTFPRIATVRSCGKFESNAQASGKRAFAGFPHA
jgi:hypothetical protein